MMGLQTPQTAVADALCEMEAEVLDVRSWAMAFQATAGPAERIDPAVINVMADALFALSDRLHTKFLEAFELARRSDRGG